MDIRTFSLDPDLTVAEIDAGTEKAWHFLPFEDRRGDLVALDERYILAVGRQTARGRSVAIFDRVERRRTNIETSDRLYAYSRPGGASTWCYAPAHRSVFILESARKRDRTYPNPWQYLRQLSVDGSINHRILIAEDFSASSVLSRDDGRIICVGLNRVAVLDPVSGEAQLSATDLIEWNRPNLPSTELKWFSTDGRWALRPHLGSVIRSGMRPHRGGRAGALLSRILPTKATPTQGDETHPDLPGDGVRRFGLALDLFRLDPIALERRLIVRYATEEELRLGAERAAILDVLADRDTLPPADGEESAETRALVALAERFHDIRWDEDGRGFTIAFTAGRREVTTLWAGQREISPDYPRMVTVIDVAERHVSLDGTVGPLRFVPGEPEPSPPLPTGEAIAAIKALVRERSSHRIECAGWADADVAASLAEMRRMIEEGGLERLVFGGQLQFRFRTGGRMVGEKKFFETVRGMPAEAAAAILPELRQLLKSYGSAARVCQATGLWPIASGPSDHSPAALSEAALTLATLDDTGFDALRDWVATVDQEHDDFAAAKVFPAIARRTGFATEPAVRFGLWFFLQQWQTVRYEKNWLGLFKAAAEVMTAAPFAAAVLEEARDVDRFSEATSVEVGLSRVKEMLGRTFWDRAVSAELDRLIGALGANAGE